MKLSDIRILAKKLNIELTTNGKRSPFVISANAVVVSTKLNAKLSNQEVLAAFEEAKALAVPSEVNPKDLMAEEVIDQYRQGARKWLIEVDGKVIPESLVRNILKAAGFPSGKRKEADMPATDDALDMYHQSAYRANRNAKVNNQ